MLSRVGREFESALVSRPGFIRTAQGPEQVGAGRVVEVVAVEGRGEGVDLGQGGFRTGGVAPCDGPVEPGERQGREVQEHVVEQHDLCPVGIGPVGGLGVAGEDRRLELVGPGLVVLRCPLEQSRRGGYGVVVPVRAILMLEQDKVSVGVESGARAGSVQSNQCQEAGNLGFGWHQVVELGCQPFGVVDQIS